MDKVRVHTIIAWDSGSDDMEYYIGRDIKKVLKDAYEGYKLWFTEGEPDPDCEKLSFKEFSQELKGYDDVYIQFYDCHVEFKYFSEEV